MDEHPCDVCWLIRGDDSPKPGTRFCRRCNAWICEAHFRNWTARIEAALRRTFGRRAIGAH